MGWGKCLLQELTLQVLKDVCDQEQITIVSSYNIKDVVTALEARPKIMELHHNKGIDMLKIECTLHILAYVCLHKSTNIKCYPFVEGDRELYNEKASMWPLIPLLSLLEKRVFKRIIEHNRNQERNSKTTVEGATGHVCPSQCVKKTHWAFTLDINWFKLPEDWS